MHPELILASASPYRRALLARLGLPFTAVAPAIDERPLAGERPVETAVRLAAAKAEAVAGRHPDRLIIGCDQVGEVEGRILGKPGGAEEAAAQLALMAGREIRFHTALCVLHREGGLIERALDCTEVRMRALEEQEIRRYLAAEEVAGCAGSFRV
ncbi:MAG: Maf family nucleotide pyrophosphatase, partial [Planctomycetota bacterium]|nr:Maf family nucleotide pyrophosphatase [Planctomycetota bacterium]